MLLRIFRVNDPYRLLGVFVALIVISLWLFVDPAGQTLYELKSIVLGEALNDHKVLYSELFTNTPPLAAWFLRWIEWIFGRSLTARHIISLLIIFFQGSYFAILLINNKAQNENTYLPALIFGVVCLFSFDMLTLSGELMGATFLIFALNNLFKEVEFRVQQDSTLLNLGVYLGIASLFIFSYSIFLPGTLIILNIFTRATIRKFLLLIFGFMLPHLLLLAYYFAKGDFLFAWNNFYLGSEWLGSNTVTLWTMVCLSAIPIVYFFLSLVMVNREARLTKYQSQLFQIMFLWLVVASIEVIVAGKMAPQKVITFAPPLSYFISHYLLLIRRKRIAELMLWIFIGGIIATSYLARYNRLKSIDYSKLFYQKSEYEGLVKQKRVLVLGTDWGLFESNKLATYFYDWQLSEKIFVESDYFEHVVLVADSFAADAPEVIIDKGNLMADVFNRNPSLKKMYKHQGDLYVLTKR